MFRRTGMSKLKTKGYGKERVAKSNRMKSGPREDVPSSARATGKSTRPSAAKNTKAKKSVTPVGKPQTKRPTRQKPPHSKVDKVTKGMRETMTRKGGVAEGSSTTVGDAQKKNRDTYVGKDGRKKAAVTREQLEASGHKTLGAYLNARNAARKDK
jgi:hypothetical protein